MASTPAAHLDVGDGSDSFPTVTSINSLPGFRSVHFQDGEERSPIPPLLINNADANPSSEASPAQLTAAAEIWEASPDPSHSRLGGGTLGSRRNIRPELSRAVSTPIWMTWSPNNARDAHGSGSFGTKRQHHVVGRDAQREWSVFEQRMENEGQLRTPRSKKRKLKSQASPSTQFRTERSRSRSAQRGTTIEGSPLVLSPIDQEFSSPRFPAPSSFGTPRTPNQPLGRPDDYDSDSSENSAESSSSNNTPLTGEPTPPSKSWFHFVQMLTLTPLQRNVLKCALAYFVGSLFTFVPTLSHFIADITSRGDGETVPSPSAHMVATIAVYFNPAKTGGAMVEADLFCLFGLFWSAFISLGSMTFYWWFEVQPGWEWLADVLVLLWVGLGMTAVSFMKVWMARPSFNTACSMISIILFIVVVKEGGLETLSQVSLIVFVGSLISNVICFVIWPQSAADNLQTNMTKTLDSFGTLLNLVTDTFLLEDSALLRQSSQGRLQRSVESHQASFTSLKKNLTEARSEWMLALPNWFKRSVRRKQLEAYEDAVDSLNRLGQHLNGLRSGTTLQHELTKAHYDGKISFASRSPYMEPGSHDTMRDQSVKGKTVDHSQSRTSELEDNAMLQAAAFIFGELVDELSPPMRALSNACIVTLQKLREALLHSSRRGDKHFDPTELVALADAIERACYVFESTSNQAVLRVYRRYNAISAATSVASLETTDDNAMLTQFGDNEVVFLVYFFIFTLQEFSKELISLVDAMGRIYSIEHHLLDKTNTWWGGLTTRNPFKTLTRRLSPSPISSEKPGRINLKRRLSNVLISNPERKKAVFPKVRPHAPDTIQTPAKSDLSWLGRMKQRLWDLSAYFKNRNVRFAIKTGMATAILAAPAFFDATRYLFVEYRGEWALISCFVVMSPTIGGTNFLSLHRITGTIFGAAVAAVVFALFSEYPIILAIFGFLFSLPCFYYIVGKPEYATSGRFVLLTYNLTCLYCYNLRHTDVSVFSVAYHRAAAVIVGVLWAAIVSRFWWPSEARRELSKSLSEFCLNVGWLYTRLLTTYTVREDSQASEFRPAHDGNIEENGNHQSSGPDERTPLMSSTSIQLNESIETFMAMELHLQIKLLELQKLLAETQHEPRLKGPFPVNLYRSILTSFQAILDKMHSMRCVTTRREWLTTVKRDFIIPVNKERREMAGNVILYFSVLSSAFVLKTPLPPYLPPAEKARQRLVDAIKQLEVVRNRDVRGSRQLLFFAYALTMKSVIQELEFLGRTLQDAFGVIGQTTHEFERLFRNEEVV